MTWLPQPSQKEVGQAIATAFRAWRTRASTHAQLRLTLVLAVVAVLAAIGPGFIALSIFPARSTAVTINGGRCTYDAAPAEPVDRLAPAPAPVALANGQITTTYFYVRNTGTCDWDPRIALYREGGSLTSGPSVISVTTVIARGFVFTAAVEFAAPQTVGLLDSTWRMRASGNQWFGTSFTFSIITHPEGVPPRYPPESLASLLGKLITLVLLILPGLLGFALAMDRAGRLVRNTYSLKSDAHGRDHVLRLLFNLGPPVSATAKEGEFKAAPDAEAIDKIGGPGWLSVHSETAALLERGGGFSRIAWPGKYLLFPFERIRTVIDLRQLNRPKTESAYTKDGIEIKADTVVSFKLIRQMDGEQIPQPAAKPFWGDLILSWLGFRVRAPKPLDKPPASPEAIRTIAYDMPAGVNWDNTVTSGLGEVIPRNMLDELWAPEDSQVNPRRELVEELISRGRENLRKRGIELIDLTMGGLEVRDKSVDRQRRDLWRTVWEKTSKATEAEGEADALRQQQTARAEAQAELIQAIAQSFRTMSLSGTIQPSDLVALRLLEVIARTMKATLDDATRDTAWPPDNAQLALERIKNIINS